MIKIRKALPTDATAIAPIMLMAMEEIVYYLIGERNEDKALTFLTDHIKRTGNKYSYEHIFIAEEDDVIIGEICLYPGASFEQLRAPILDYLRFHFNRDLLLDQETKAGEVYIDTLAVVVSARGKGIGKMLLMYVIDMFVHRQQEILGLLVDKENPKAKKLYVNMGFKVIGDVHLFGKELEHLQYS